MGGVRAPFFRRVLGVVPGIGAIAEAADRQTIQQKAKALAVAMAMLHGGDWIAQIDHDAGFILVRPRSDRGPQPSDG